MIDTEERNFTEAPVGEILEKLRKMIVEEVSAKGSALKSAAKLPQNGTTRAIIEFFFDQAHTAFEFYKRLAHELLSKDHFPNRRSRWPGFFGVDQSTTSTGGDN